MVTVNKIFLNKVKHDNLNNLDLRSDIENDRIDYSYEYETTLSFEGYVGNSPNGDDGKEHEDDTWAIDLQQNDVTVESYLYSSKYEYLQDIELLSKFK